MASANVGRAQELSMLSLIKNNVVVSNDERKLHTSVAAKKTT